MELRAHQEGGRDGTSVPGCFPAQGGQKLRSERSTDRSDGLMGYGSGWPLVPSLDRFPPI